MKYTRWICGVVWIIRCINLIIATRCTFVGPLSSHFKWKLLFETLCQAIQETKEGSMLIVFRNVQSLLKKRTIVRYKRKIKKYICFLKNYILCPLCWPWLKLSDDILHILKRRKIYFLIFNMKDLYISTNSRIFSKTYQLLHFFVKPNQHTIIVTIVFCIETFVLIRTSVKSILLLLLSLYNI